MIRRLHHVGIVTANIEGTMQHYVERFGCQPARIVSVHKPGIKLRTAMLTIGSDSGNHIQLIEPEIGPGVEELRTRGEGTIMEMAFEVEDIEAFSQQMRSQGLAPVNLLGEPIDGHYLIASSGNRYLYLPKDKTLGTSIEIIQVVST